MALTYQVSIDDGAWLDMSSGAPMIVKWLAALHRYNSLRLRSVDPDASPPYKYSDPSEYVGAGLTKAPPVPFAIRVNCGFDEQLPFEADDAHSYHGGTGTASGSYFNPSSVTGVLEPGPSTIYFSARYAAANGNFTYTLPVVADREYRVRLHFAVNTSSPWLTNVPMTLTVNGGTPAAFDPYVEAGSPGAAQRYIKEFVVQQGASTSLTITLTGTSGEQPFLNGLEVIEIPGIIVFTPDLPDGKAGTAYTWTVAARDAIGAVTWALTSGALPSGLSLNASTGVISGTPTTAGTYWFLISATDAAARTVTRVFNILIDTVPVSYLLDSITTAPAAAYSVRKLRSAYAGACCRVIRISDAVEHDVPFNACMVMDKADLLTFAGGNRVRWIKWYDQTGNGKDQIATGGPAGSAPDTTYSYFRGVRPGALFSEALAGSSTALGMVAASVTLALPAVFIAGHFKLDGKVERNIWTTDPIRGMMYKGGLSLYGSTFYTWTTPYNGGVDQITFFFKTGTDEVRINGTAYPCLATANSGANPSDTGITNQEFRLGTYFGNTSFEGVFGEVIVVSNTGTLSNADRDAIETSQMAYFRGSVRSDPLPFVYDLTLEGDSTTYGYGSSVDPGVVLATQLGVGWRVRNVANSGQHLISEMTSDAAVQVDPYFAATPASVGKVLHIWAGVNDFHDNPSLTGATLYAALQTYVAARKAANPALKVIVATITPVDPANGYLTSGAEGERKVFNDLVRGGWFDFADGINDLDALPALADYTDTTIYAVVIPGVDFGLHFTTLAYTDHIVPAMKAAALAVI